MKPDKMTDELFAQYQALLEDAVAVTGAERGMIVLHDSAAEPPLGFLVTINVDQLPLPPPPPPAPVDHEYTETEYVWEMLTQLIVHAQPVRTDNADPSCYFFRKVNIIDWSLRSILAVPLHKKDEIYGLLWCDQRVRNSIFTADDLTSLVDLVQHFHAAG
jgi:hypothetical protein